MAIRSIVKSCVRPIVRSVVRSDGLDILDYSPLAWWSARDASTITDAGGGKVSAWADKSGNGYTATQGTDANRPITGTANIGGLNAIDGTGATSLLTTVPGAKSCIAVNGFVSTDSLEICFLGSDSARNNELFYRPSSGGEVSFDGTGTATGKYSVNNAALSASVANATTIGFGAENIITYSQFDTAFQIDEILGRGGLIASNTPKYGEVIWWDRDLTAQEISELVPYLANIWSISI